jgi:hypothetical protein
MIGERHHLHEQHTHHVLHPNIQCNDLLVNLATVQLKGVNGLESQDNSYIFCHFLCMHVVEETCHG